jgi:hypothetical protein
MLKPLSHIMPETGPNSDMRTEDIRFSPSGRMLAAVSTNGTILLFTIDAVAPPSRSQAPYSCAPKACKVRMASIFLMRISSSLLIGTMH